MHIFERYCKAIRHNYFLEQADWLWDHIRPLYEKILPLLSGNHGIEQIINGTDRILIPIQLRSLSEVYEPQVWKYLMAQVRPGDIVADIGANIGLYTVALAKRVGSSGRVFVFEPEPDNCIVLKELIELNKVSAQVELIEMAAGCKDSIVKFSAGLSTGSHINHAPTKGTFTVRCVRLDTIFSDKRLDILKIDVEGTEEEVFKGATKLLTDPKRSPRFILIEVHPYRWSNIGTTSESLFDFIKNYKYSILDKNGQFVSNIDFWDWVIAYKK